MISKEEFKSWTEEQQKEYIINLSKEGNTVEEMATNHLDYSEKGLRKRIGVLGLTYNKKAKQYEITKSNNESNKVIDEVIINKEESNNKSNDEVIKNVVDKVITNMDMGNFKSNIEGNNNGNNEVTRKEFLELKNTVEQLAAKLEGLNTVEKEPGAIDLKRFKGEPVNRTFKLYEEVQEDFKEFCEKHKRDYKVQDLISQALFEFMEKYK
jgi:hypothetical protein